jgi:hypothetical protein
MVDEQGVRMSAQIAASPSMLHNSYISKPIIDLDNPIFLQNRKNHKTSPAFSIDAPSLDLPFCP